MTTAKLIIRICSLLWPCKWVAIVSGAKCMHFFSVQNSRTGYETETGTRTGLVEKGYDTIEAVSHKNGPRKKQCEAAVNVRKP